MEKIIDDFLFLRFLFTLRASQVYDGGMKRFVMFTIFAVLSFNLLPAQVPGTPGLEITILDDLDYDRPARLEEEDRKAGRTFRFSSGLEIVTDIEYVKVYLFDAEVGRTPYENNSIAGGYYRIRLEKPGFDDFSFWVNVRKDYRTTVLVSYKAEESLTAPPSGDGGTVESGPLYGTVNPDDPGYYTMLLYSRDLFDTSDTDLVVVDSAGKAVVTLNAAEAPGGNFVYHWRGNDAEGERRPDGEYGVFLSEDPGNRSELILDRRYTRKAADYFTGYTGLVLVPSARLLFPGSFQFGSVFSADFMQTENRPPPNLPFSVFLRTSPLPRWEAAAEGEVSFHPDGEQPTFKVNTSHKVHITGRNIFQFSMAGRFSWRAGISDLTDVVTTAVIRDPSGVSLAFPVQFRVSGWDFYVAPDIIYSFEPLTGYADRRGQDFSGAFRWGVSYTDVFFSAALSSALHSRSIKGSPLVMQVSLEGALYPGDTPLYIRFYTVSQNIHKRDDSLAVGMSLGFLF